MAESLIAMFLDAFTAEAAPTEAATLPIRVTVKWQHTIKTYLGTACDTRKHPGNSLLYKRQGTVAWHYCTLVHAKLACPCQ